MKLHLPGLVASLSGRIRGVFNLNDPRWGRGNGEDGKDQRPDRPEGPQGPNQGPPDLDELWRDFNRKLGGLFGGGKNNNPNRGGFGRGNGNGGGGEKGGVQPPIKKGGHGGWPVSPGARAVLVGTRLFFV